MAFPGQNLVLAAWAAAAFGLQGPGLPAAERWADRLMRPPVEPSIIERWTRTACST